MMDHSEEFSEAAGRSSPVDQNAYEQIIREVREKERELDKRTELLENMMRFFYGNLPGTPMTPEALQGNVPPHFHFSTPSHGALPSTSYPAGSLTSGFSSPYSKSSLRDALDLVPKYDGRNIPVWQFARACKRAKESVPLVDEPQFVRMLRNKLSDHAYLAVEDETHSTVSQFLDALKRVFGPGRNANYYRGQLSIAYKKPAEHVLDYIGRIKDLRAAIIEGDQINLDRTLTETEISSIDSFALEAFYEGLPRDHRVELRAEGYNGFSDACSKVIAISKRLEREEARYKNARTSHDASTPSTRILQRDPSAKTSPPSSSSTSSSVSNIPEGGARKICTYCKNFGHLFNECRKRQYRENLANNANNLPSQETGNGPRASAEGTSRGLANARPAMPIEFAPAPSTSSEEMTGMCHQSSSSPTPFENAQHSC